MKVYGKYYYYEVPEYRLEPVQVDVGRLLGSTFLSSTLGAILGASIYGQFPPKTREEWGRFIASFIASGFAGLVLSLLSQAVSGGR